MIDFVFDGNSLFARSWYAAQSSGESNPDEYAVEIAHSLVFGLMDSRNDRIGVKPDRTLFCWDTTQKKDKERTPKPPEYHEAIRSFRKSLTQLIGAAHAKIEGHESDDLVATAAYSIPESHEVYVISGDKDLQQLQGGNIKYYCLNQKQVLSRMAILSRWKVKRPSQIALALAIIGDSGDRIPGIKGWGPKKAEKLFEYVDPDMDFKEAMDAITAHMPPKAHQEFMESLELTLLQPDIPDVPEPNVVTPCSASEAYDLTTGKATNAFLRLRTLYVDTGADDAALINSLESENWDP